jgi:transcriptional regulator with XRE-family HTH domain
VRVGLILFLQNHYEENLYIGKNMSDGKQKIAPEIGKVFQRYRKKRLNPATNKTWTLEDLGKEVSKVIQKYEGNQEGGGLSFSAISRLENGSLLPSKAKLKILADFLEIPESELKPYIQLKSLDLNLSHAPQNESIKIRELAQRENKSFLDWLRLLSYCNIAADYTNTLEFAEEALLEIDQAKPSIEDTITRYLIQSKKSYAQYMLTPKNSSHLNRSLEWVSRAEQLWASKQLNTPSQVDSLWSLNILRIETLRCLLTASLERFNAEFVVAPRLNSKAKDAIELEYQELFELVAQIEKNLNPQEWEKGFNPVQLQELFELYLYFRREKDRFNFKWLEAIEMYSLWEYTEKSNLLPKGPIHSIDQIPLQLAAQLQESQEQEKILSFIQTLFAIEKGEILFSPATAQQEEWQALHKSMLDTISLHDLLDEPEPNKGYQEGVMLYPITAARVGKFSEIMDVSYFKLIYMLTNAITRPTWYYVRAYCYALWYKQTQDLAHLDLSIANWANYCKASPQYPEEYNPERFAHLLGEAALWSAYLPLLFSQNMAYDYPYIQWLLPPLKSLFNQEIDKLR